MNLVKFQNPRYSVNRNLVDELFNNFLVNDSQPSSCSHNPAANVYETEKDFNIELALPGFDKEEVELKFHNDILTISAKHKEDKEVKELKYVRREFGTKNYTKRYELPETANVEKIAAAFKNGILTITIPKKEEAVEKAPIEIKIS